MWILANIQAVLIGFLINLASNPVRSTWNHSSRYDSAVDHTGFFASLSRNPNPFTQQAGNRIESNETIESN